jgi:hypothetical protein
MICNGLEERTGTADFGTKEEAMIHKGTTDMGTL